MYFQTDYSFLVVKTQYKVFRLLLNKYQQPPILQAPTMKVSSLRRARKIRCLQEVI
jgi:hypothetical protein